jgi:repressor LexA
MGRKSGSIGVSVTKRQKEVLDFISGFIASNGYAPTFKEIGEAVGVHSSATVYKFVEILRRKRLIAMEYGQRRGIEINGNCPTCGQKVLRRRASA